MGGSALAFRYSTRKSPPRTRSKGVDSEHAEGLKDEEGRLFKRRVNYDEDAEDKFRVCVLLWLLLLLLNIVVIDGVVCKINSVFYCPQSDLIGYATRHFRPCHGVSGCQNLVVVNVV